MDYNRMQIFNNTIYQIYNIEDFESMKREVLNSLKHMIPNRCGTFLMAPVAVPDVVPVAGVLLAGLSLAVVPPAGERSIRRCACLKSLLKWSSGTPTLRIGIFQAGFCAKAGRCLLGLPI